MLHMVCGTYFFILIEAKQSVTPHDYQLKYCYFLKVTQDNNPENYTFALDLSHLFLMHIFWHHHKSILSCIFGIYL